MCHFDLGMGVSDMRMPEMSTRCGSIRRLASVGSSLGSLERCVLMEAIRVEELDMPPEVIAGLDVNGRRSRFAARHPLAEFAEIFVAHDCHFKKSV